MALRKASVRTQFSRMSEAQSSTSVRCSISRVATRSLASLSTPMRHMPPKAMMAVINRMTPKPRPRRGPTRRLLKFMVVSDIGYRVTMEQTGVGGWSMCLLPGTSLALGLGV